tara:strand:+ start:514 stop:1914 length:1401 start_codon:yes stop_codon:yes gene_type:complete
MTPKANKKLSERSPDQSYMDILDSDTIPSPEFFREGPNPDVDNKPVLTSRYHERSFFENEVKYVWPHVWQWACREEDIPNIGDHHIYDCVGKSFIIVRTKENEIKALINSCLHRGRQILASDGNLSEFRCAYHGLSWNFDGSFKENPFGWDCPDWNGGAPDLPEAKVETWAGFVFINMDHNAPPLATVLGPIPKHFERYDLANRYKAVHVSKKIRANWKLTTEAFMESHHVIGTHPQGLPMTADINSQYDIWNDYVGRQFTAHTVQSPHIKRICSEQEIFEAFTNTGVKIDLVKNPEMSVPEGMTARTFTAQLFRENLKNETGHDFSHAGDAEMVDSLLYNIFPNISFWAGMVFNTCYRFKPNGLDPDTSIMDIVLLKPIPKGQPRPKPASTIFLDFDEPFTDASDELGSGLSMVFEQDAINLPYVHNGLKASVSGTVEFTKYMEAKLRLNHLVIDRMIAEGESKE